MITFSESRTYFIKITITILYDIRYLTPVYEACCDVTLLLSIDLSWLWTGERTEFFKYIGTPIWHFKSPLILKLLNPSLKSKLIINTFNWDTIKAQNLFGWEQLCKHSHTDQFYYPTHFQNASDNNWWFYHLDNSLSCKQTQSKNKPKNNHLSHSYS